MSLLTIAARVAADVPVPSARQKEDFNCGPTCLKAALKYLGIEADDMALTALALTSPETGAEAWSLAGVAEAFGVDVELRHGMTVDDLAQCLEEGRVCIIQVQAYAEDPGHDYSGDDEFGHYVIPTDISDGIVSMMDPDMPEDSRALLTVEELMERWHGDEAGANRPGVAVVMSGRPENPDRAPKKGVPLD